MLKKSLKSILAIIAAQALLIGCKSNTASTTTPPQGTPISKASDTITLESDKDFFISWEAHYKADDIHFSLDSFDLFDTISVQLISTTANISDSFFSKYSKLIVYNKDSSLFIDPFSYSLIIENSNGKLVAREGEADHEVAIVNVKTNTRKRLLFCGPSCQIQKVFWHNNDIVGIMGLSSEYADEYFTPKIWYVNIHNGITIPYEYHSNVSIIEAQEYFKNKLKVKGLK